MRLVNNVQFAKATDVTYQLTPIALWTVAEIASGIICGALPTQPSLFRHYVPKLRTHMGTFNKYGSNSKHGENSKSGSNSVTGPMARPQEWAANSSYVELEEGRQYGRADVGMRTAVTSNPGRAPRGAAERKEWNNVIHKTMDIEHSDSM
jgi:hypothetical protein